MRRRSGFSQNNQFAPRYSLYRSRLKGNSRMRLSFFAVVFFAVISVVLFSGQVRRPYAPPQQPQQRQQAPVQQRQQTPPVQRQVTPQRPATPVPTNPAPAPATEMPSLFWLPEDIQFPEMPPGGSPTITLFGDPRAEGLYVTRTLIPHGTKTIPHFHPDSRTITVLSGVCYYGRGEEFDEDRVIPMPSGSFFTEPAGIPHYIWAKDGDVIVQTTAIGPSATIRVPARTSNTAP